MRKHNHKQLIVIPTIPLYFNDYISEVKMDGWVAMTFNSIVY